MVKKDTITKEYLADPKIFADAFNYFIFDGEKVIKPKDLQEQDPTEIAVVDKRGRTFMDQKMRDLLKRCTIRYYKQATLMLLGIEAQDRIHYYELNLITPDEINDFSKFSSDLGAVLEFIQYSDDKKKLRDIIEKEERYKGVDVRTVDMINAYTNANISKKDAK